MDRAPRSKSQRERDRERRRSRRQQEGASVPDPVSPTIALHQTGTFSSKRNSASMDDGRLKKSSMIPIADEHHQELKAVTRSNAKSKISGSGHRDSHGAKTNGVHAQIHDANDTGMTQDASEPRSQRLSTSSQVKRRRSQVPPSASSDADVVLQGTPAKMAKLSVNDAVRENSEQNHEPTVPCPGERVCETQRSKSRPSSSKSSKKSKKSTSGSSSRNRSRPPSRPDSKSSAPKIEDVIASPLPKEPVERRGSLRVRAREEKRAAFQPGQQQQLLQPAQPSGASTRTATPSWDDDFSELSDLPSDDDIMSKRTPRKGIQPSETLDTLKTEEANANHLNSALVELKATHQAEVADLTENLEQLREKYHKAAERCKHLEEQWLLESQGRRAANMMTDSTRRDLADTKLRLERAEKDIKALEIERAELSRSTGTYAIDFSPMKVSSEYRAFINELFKVARQLVTAPPNRARSTEIMNRIKGSVIEGFKGEGTVLLPSNFCGSKMENPLKGHPLPDLVLSQGHVAWYVAKCISQALWAAYAKGNPVAAHLDRVEGEHNRLFFCANSEKVAGPQTVEERAASLSRSMWQRARHDLARYWATTASELATHRDTTWEAYTNGVANEIQSQVESLEIQVQGCTILGESALDKLKQLVRLAARVWFLILAVDPDWHVRFPAPGTPTTDDPRIDCKAVLQAVDAGTRAAVHRCTVVLFAVHPSIVMGDGDPSAKDVVERSSVIAVEIEVPSIHSPRSNEEPLEVPASGIDGPKRDEEVSVDGKVSESVPMMASPSRKKDAPEQTVIMESDSDDQDCNGSEATQMESEDRLESTTTQSLGDSLSACELMRPFSVDSEATISSDGRKSKGLFSHDQRVFSPSISGASPIPGLATPEPNTSVTFPSASIAVEEPMDVDTPAP